MAERARSPFNVARPLPNALLPLQQAEINAACAVALFRLNLYRHNSVTGRNSFERKKQAFEMKPYRITLLGGLKFHSEAQIITRFRTQKTASLLAYLALHRGPQPREVIADLLWPAVAPDDARHSLRMALSSLRGQLESGLQTAAQARAPLFEVTRFAIGLCKGAVSSDVAEFEIAIQNARYAVSDTERARFYGVAASLYNGEFLPGFYDDWCVEIAARLEVSRDEASQFLGRWQRARDEITPVAERDSQPRKASARSGAQTTLATLLLFDGAPLSSNLKKQWRAWGASPRVAPVESEIPPQIWLFSGATAALQSALLLRDETTSGDDATGRRIAICTGELTRNDSGALLQRGWGLLESAHAGQMLCCEATALFERERADVACRELGAFHLPRALGSTAPERIFQISRRGDGATEFAPIYAQPARGVLVPRPLDAFFGRVTELESLRALLQRERLVTLAGAGGAGKTRLALQLAAQLEGEHAAPFGGAVFWVALADVPDASGIAAAICDALRLPAGAASTAFERAGAALHRVPATLLVLDNFEHLVEEGAALLEQLLERAPGAHCLVTSRQLLGTHGETEFALTPLPVAHLGASAATLELLRAEPSVALFCARARAVRPDFALTARNAESVAALCQHLEGIPLALELAAARVASLSPARVLEHLQQHQARSDASDEPLAFERLDFLCNTARTAPTRHRTLRATLSWSFEQLEPALQKLLCRLCVFRGGATAQAASQVCEMPDAAGALEELRTRSLLARVTDEDDDARYSMLETVRQFAFEVAARRGEVEQMRRNHARYFLGWAQNEAPHAVSPDAPARMQSWRRVRSHADNLRAAIRHNRDRDPVSALQLILACQAFTGLHLSRLEIDIETALRAVEAHQPNIEFGVLAEALGLAAIQAAHRGDIAAQTAFARRRMELASAAPDAAPDALGWAYFHWGSALHRGGKAREARASLQRSLGYFERQEPPLCHQCRAWTLIEMGNNAFDSGDFADATRDYQACIAAFAVSGDRDGQASARAQLADVLFHAGQHERAARLWHEVAAIERELGDEREHEWRRHQQGKLAVARGELERGHALLLRALRAFAGDGEKLGILRSVLALSQYWLHRERPERARRLLQAEAAERRRLGWPADGGWQTLRAQLWQRAGDGEEFELESLETIVAQELDNI